MARRRKNSSPKYGEAGWKAAWDKHLGNIRKGVDQVSDGISTYERANRAIRDMDMPLAVRKLAARGLKTAYEREYSWRSIADDPSIMRSALAESSPPDLRWQNPKRRKNIMSSAAGSYDDYGSSHSPRSYKRDRNPYSKRYTLASFSKKYWGQGYEEVDRTTRMAFWDDFKYAFIGGLGRYKEETRG